MSVNKGIQYISDQALCTACGACSGVCPTHAVNMQWNAAGYLVAQIDPVKCISCGLCVKICPSIANNKVVMDNCDPFHGICLNAYIGHATDAETRQKSQSGGVVTALLCFLLDQRQIDGAIVNRFCARTKRPEVVFASSRDELLQAAGSYYCQSSVVKAIVDHSDKKSAAVVLGCQAESLALLRKEFRGFKGPEFVIGLICAGQYSSHNIDRLIALSKADPSCVDCVRFRDKSSGGWPGDVKVYTSKCEYVLDKAFRHRLKPIYEAYRCMLCFDQMNVYSDIVVGDPWGVTRSDNSIGNTVFIARTSRGQHLIDEAVAHGYIKTTNISVAEVLQGQTVDGRLKKSFFAAVEFCQKAKYPLPICICNITGVRHGRLTWKGRLTIIERLRYSREVYLERDFCKIAALRRRMNCVLQIRRTLGRTGNLVFFPFRVFRWAVKKAQNILVDR